MDYADVITDKFYDVWGSFDAEAGGNNVFPSLTALLAFKPSEGDMREVTWGTSVRIAVLHRPRLPADPATSKTQLIAPASSLAMCCSSVASCFRQWHTASQAPTPMNMLQVVIFDNDMDEELLLIQERAAEAIAAVVQEGPKACAQARQNCRPNVVLA